MISSWMLFPTAFPNPRVTHTASGSLMCSRPSPAVASPMIVPALSASATTSTPIRGTVSELGLQCFSKRRPERFRLGVCGGSWGTIWFRRELDIEIKPPAERRLICCASR